MKETNSEDLKPLRTVAEELEEKRDRMRRWIKSGKMRAKKEKGKYYLDLREARRDRDRILWSIHWTTRLRKKLKVEAEGTVLKVTRWAVGGIVALTISAPFGVVGLLLGPTLVTRLNLLAPETWEVSETGAKIGGFVSFLCIFWIFCVVRSGDKAVEYARRMWGWNSKLEQQFRDLDRRLRKMEEQLVVESEDSKNERFG